MDSKEDESFILEHEKKLVHFHMHDAAGNKNHLALGTGEIDLKEKFEIVGKRNCRCVLEQRLFRHSGSLWHGCRKMV